MKTLKFLARAAGGVLLLPLLPLFLLERLWDTLSPRLRKPKRGRKPRAAPR